jgi:viroplasmin and RNaseH domain-containing protein
MDQPVTSKPLGGSDESGFNFAKEMLDGDVTSAINFDRLQKHPSEGYIIFEYLLCDEKQTVDPFTSHPNRYWKNKGKFLALWKASNDLKATLYLVNYAKKGTVQENKILLIEVKEMDDEGIKKDIQTKMTRDEFKQFFRKLNKECL